MTEPSDDAVRLMHKIRTYGKRSEFAMDDKFAAREIDALTEQRVAAALEPWEQLRVACADILGRDTDWPQHGNAAVAIASALCLRVKWLREAEQRVAAAVANAEQVIQAARSFCGESENCLPCKGREAAIVAYDGDAAPWCKDALFVLTTHGDGAATTLHRGWEAICDAVVAVHYFEPDSDQRDEIIARFTDWEIWQNQGGVPWLWHSDYEDGAVTVQRVTVPPKDAGGPASTNDFGEGSV